MPISASILKRYLLPSRKFVETGTHVGEGVQAALDAGYQHVYTCDLNINVPLQRFKDDVRVSIAEGDSRECLALFRNFADLEPSVFWLDAHATDGGSGSYGDCPLLGELEELAKYRIKTHTILIDDARLIGSDALRLDKTSDNYSMWKLLDAIRNINPDYNVNLVHSPLFCFDIIACTP